jgi:cysteine desulfurase / selenocysteine lyase
VVSWEEVRSRFPSLEGKTYLNTATMGQLPRAATEAVVGHLQRRDVSACADLLDWFADMERVRGKVAQLIHAQREDIAFVPSTAHALSIVLNGIDWKAGDQILTFEDEFPNNTYAPALLTRRGVEFLEVPLADWRQHVTERTRLVMVSALNYVTGLRAPLKEMSAALRANGTLLYVDGTQGVGGLQLDVTEIQPDVLGVHGYKWLLSPTGAGFVYVRPEVRQWLEPNVVGWRSHRTWGDLDNLHHGVPVFAADASRYECGMPALPLLYGMEASVDLMLEIGPERIEERVLHLARVLAEGIVGMGGSVENLHSPILAVKFAGRDSSELARDLAARKVLVSARHGFLRVSVHLYNDESDIGVLLGALRELGVG